MKSLIASFSAMLLSVVAFAQSGLNEVVHFNYDKSALTSQTQSELDDLIANIGDRELYKITLSGHTDSDGTDQYNEGLSSRRVEAVKSYLIEHGVEPHHFQMSTFGEHKPVASNVDLSEKYLNRRVEIHVEFEGKIPTGFTGECIEMQVNTLRDTSIVLDNYGTILHIPANAFEYDENQGDCEEVTIKYKEYRNSADMAFCQIPMNYEAGGTDYRFNSSGMFEIHGSCNNRPIKVAAGKSMTIDYALAKQNPDIAFFRLKDDGSNWDRIQEIQGFDGADIMEEQIQNKALFAENIQHKKRWLIHIGDIKIFRLKDKIIDNGEKIVAWNQVAVKQDKQFGTLLAEGANAGHTYPDVIKGLNVGSFGVYNCDQAYRMQAVTNITSNFVTEDGTPINDAYVLSMIDMDYNGAFSFDPLGFQCNPKGKNALALFTRSDQLYILTPDEFEKMNISVGSGTYTFTMKNITQEIHNSKELAEYLGIDLGVKG